MISLVVCTYNREKYIGGMLDRIADNQYDTGLYEIVLIDNNSTDRTAEICADFVAGHPDIPFRYFLEKEQGLSHARNRGIRESVGDVIVFLDDDAFVCKDYLRNLQARLDANPDAAAFGGRIDPLFESGSAPRWLCRWTLSWVSALDLGNEVRLFGNKYPIGANMGFRRETLERCGSFSTRLGRSGKNMMGGEEKDLFLRVSANGGKIYYFPDVRVSHVIPESRTTRDYVVRFARGVGMSEYVRCRDQGGGALFKRRISELVKWGASFMLWFLYLLKGKPQCGNMLLLFRWNVSRNLFFKET